MELLKLKELAGVGKNKSAREAYNQIIGVYFPGGNEVLDVCERLHKALHGARKGDPMLQDMLDALLEARNQMVEAIQKSEDGIFVRI